MDRRTLGTVTDVVQDGSLLVQSPPIPRGEAPEPPLGARVVDNRNGDVGKVREILGPVHEPWFVVEPLQGTTVHRLVGKDVYER